MSSTATVQINEAEKTVEMAETTSFVRELDDVSGGAFSEVTPIEIKMSVEEKIELINFLTDPQPRTFGNEGLKKAIREQIEYMGETEKNALRERIKEARRSRGHQ